MPSFEGLELCLAPRICTKKYGTSNFVHPKMILHNLSHVNTFDVPGEVQSTYRTRAIISRGLYFFYPIFTLAAAYIADNLCTKNGNSSFF